MKAQLDTVHPTVKARALTTEHLAVRTRGAAAAVTAHWIPGNAVFAAKTAQPALAGSVSSDQRPSTDAERADLEAKRTWVRNHYAEDARHKYETLEGKLVLLDTILRSGWIAPHETLKLQCLGVTFGDALAQALGLEWMTVEDEHGRDPCLVVPGTSTCLFPLTSISKRVERGEHVDVRELFEAAPAAVERMRAKGC